MPVERRPAPPISVPPPATPIFVPAPLNSGDRTSPFASVAEASTYLKESKRTVRELVARGVFKLAPNSNGKEKPWRLLWSEIEAQAAEQMERAA
jgi:hypothetical protein